MKEKMAVVHFKNGCRPWGLVIPATMTGTGKRQTRRFDTKEYALHGMKSVQQDIERGVIEHYNLKRKQTEALEIVKKYAREKNQIMLILNESEVEILKRILGRLS